MKKLFVLCAVAFMTISISAFAQEKNSEKSECAKTEKTCCKGEENKGKCIDLKECANNPQCAKVKDCKNGEPCKVKDCKRGERKGECRKGGPKHVGKHHGMRGKECGAKCDKALEGITLTEAQKAKVEELKSNMRKDREKFDKTIGKKSEKMRGKFKDEMKKILTAEQYAKFKVNLEKDKLEKGRKEAKGERSGNRTADAKKGPAPKMVTE